MAGMGVLVVSFPEPESLEELDKIIKSVKRQFADRLGIKVHMGINNVADAVIAIFDPLHQGENNGKDLAGGE